jgi:predicted RNA polymerase sigma factor
LARYGDEVIRLIRLLLSQSSYDKKVTALAALTHLAEVREADFAPQLPELLPLLVENASSRIWDGQLKVLRALQHIARATASVSGLNADPPSLRISVEHQWNLGQDHRRRSRRRLLS